jgi:dTDP-4-amino-4,6-dideoxygalactose transaminase
MTHAPDGPWYYQQVALGYNYRMSDVQAALGTSQMARVDDYVGRRHVLARRYDALLADLPMTTPWQHPEGYSGLHLYVVRLRRERIAHTHREVFESLRRDGIGVNLHYIPVHLQPYYRAMGFGEGDFPESERFYGDAITLPLYPGLTERQQDDVVAALNRALA